jgi:hypothetical protein
MMKMAADQVQKAQSEGLVMIQVEMDGRYCNPPRGDFSATGTIPVECRNELLAMVRRWIDEGKF